jgi:hypothetical protein
MMVNTSYLKMKKKMSTDMVIYMAMKLLKMFVLTAGHYPIRMTSKSY